MNDWPREQSSPFRNRQTSSDSSTGSDSSLPDIPADDQLLPSDRRMPSLLQFFADGEFTDHPSTPHHDDGGPWVRNWDHDSKCSECASDDDDDSEDDL